MRDGRRDRDRETSSFEKSGGLKRVKQLRRAHHRAFNVSIEGPGSGLGARELGAGAVWGPGRGRGRVAVCGRGPRSRSAVAVRSSCGAVAVAIGVAVAVRVGVGVVVAVAVAVVGQGRGSRVGESRRGSPPRPSCSLHCPSKSAPLDARRCQNEPRTAPRSSRAPSSPTPSRSEGPTCALFLRNDESFRLLDSDLTPQQLGLRKSHPPPRGPIRLPKEPDERPTNHYVRRMRQYLRIQRRGLGTVLCRARTRRPAEALQGVPAGLTPSKATHRAERGGLLADAAPARRETPTSTGARCRTARVTAEPRQPRRTDARLGRSEIAAAVRVPAESYETAECEGTRLPAESAASEAGSEEPREAPRTSPGPGPSGRGFSPSNGGGASYLEGARGRRGTAPRRGCRIEPGADRSL